jgi:hypothetical protein
MLRYRLCAQLAVDEERFTERERDGLASSVLRCHSRLEEASSQIRAADPCTAGAGPSSPPRVAVELLPADWAGGR